MRNKSALSALLLNIHLNKQRKHNVEIISDSFLAKVFGDKSFIDSFLPTQRATAEKVIKERLKNPKFFSDLVTYLKQDAGFYDRQAETKKLQDVVARDLSKEKKSLGWAGDVSTVASAAWSLIVNITKTAIVISGCVVVADFALGQLLASELAITSSEVLLLMSAVFIIGSAMAIYQEISKSNEAEVTSLIDAIIIGNTRNHFELDLSNVNTRGVEAKKIDKFQKINDNIEQVDKMEGLDAMKGLVYAMF
jgi:hypothetical protein